jgi:hypothetical protein
VFVQEAEVNATTKFLNGLLGFFVLLVVSVGTCFAQSTATLSGVVTDPSGAVVGGAQVTVHSLATGLDRTLVTDSAGLYVAPSLEPGDYQVQVKATGFSQYTVKKVTLQVDQRVTVNTPLAVSSAGETIQVESTASQIETTTMTVGQVIDRQTVQEIPLNGRHFLDLTVLTPGGVVAPTAGSLTAASRGLGANSFITAGNREDSVNFQINGVNLNDMSQNQITFQPSINTTSEFKINNSTFSAEYGRSSGSIVNVSTKSGSNAFHGEVFDYFRNEALDARNYFNRASLPGLPGRKAPLKRNNFGGAIGGPIWRDRTFFFGSYEGLRQSQGVLLNSNVFSPATRAEILAHGQPAAKALIALVPVGNDATQTHFTAFTPGPVQINQYTLDILQKITNADQLHGFYAFQSDSRTEPNLQGNTIPGFGDHRPAHRQIFTLNETHIFNPSFVNEARLGLNRISIVFTPNTPLNPVDFHIGDGVTTASGIPQITVSDLSLNFGGPAGFPQGRNDTFGVFSDAATLLRGKHTIKFGGEFRRFIGSSFAGDTGTLTYATTAQFEADIAPTFNINPATVSSRIFINAQGYFIQDNYKLDSHLTLEYGFRFEWNGTPTEGANRLAIFDPGTVSLVRTRTNGFGGIYGQNYNYMPRVGFAWDVFATGKTVLRGGYSILSDQPVSGTATGLASNPPFSNAVTYSNAGAPIPVSNLFASAAAAGIAINSTNRNFRNAYTESFNLNLQQAGPAGIVFSAGYYGSLGKHLRARTNQNQPIAGGPARPFTKLSATSPIDPGASIANVNISEANSVGTSNYNAMWLTASKNAGHGLSFDMNYNWSKSLDTNSLGSQGGFTFQDSNNPQNNYGPSDFDTRNHFAGRTIYVLPFKGNRFIEGFQFSGIVQYQTGNPLTISYNTSTYTGVAGLIRVNQVAPATIKKIQQPGATNVSYIQSTVCPIAPTLAAIAGCSFQNPATQATSTSPIVFTGLGTMSRGVLFGPGFADVDISGEKNTKITERLTLKLRVDAFDVLNHPNFGQPTSNSTSASFGQIASTRFATSDAGSSRQLQISGKFVF